MSILEHKASREAKPNRVPLSGKDSKFSSSVSKALGIDTHRMIFLGKHGNDTNDGKTLDKAVLTYGAAKTLAAALTPASNALVVIRCLDAGIYTENIDIPQYCILDAEEATFTGNHTITSDTIFNAYKTTAAAGIGVLKSGSGYTIVNIEYWDCVNAFKATAGTTSLSWKDIIAAVGMGIYAENDGTVVRAQGNYINNASGSHCVRAHLLAKVFIDVGDLFCTNIALYATNGGKIWATGGKCESSTTAMACNAITTNRIYALFSEVIGSISKSSGKIHLFNPAGVSDLQSLKFATGGTIDEFSTDGTLAGNSDTAVPTEKAVKTYVDTGNIDDKAKISANDTTAGYLNGKLVEGTNVTLTENDDGGNETLSISVPDASTTTKGAMEKATQAELTNGTANKFPDCTVVKAGLDGVGGGTPDDNSVGLDQLAHTYGNDKLIGTGATGVPEAVDKSSFGGGSFTDSTLQVKTANYQFVDADKGKTTVFNGNNLTCTAPVVDAASHGQVFHVMNINANTLYIANVTGLTILAENESATFIVDNTNSEARVLNSAIDSNIWKIKSVENFSGVTQKVVTGFTSSVQVELSNVLTSDATYMRLQTSTNGGSVYDSGASDYKFSSMWNDVSTGIHSGGSDSFSLIGLNSNALTTTLESSYRVEILNPQIATGRKQIEYLSQCPGSTGNTHRIEHGSGARMADGDINGLRFFPQSGTFSGTITTWVKK